MLVKTRYPFTYSADAIRGITGGPSRAEAATLLTQFANILGFDRNIAACDFADRYIQIYYPECMEEAAILRKEFLDEQLRKVAAAEADTDLVP